MRRDFGRIDWTLFLATLPIIGAGLVTMSSFVGETSFFGKQLISAILAVCAFFGASYIDIRFLKQTKVLVSIFLLCSALLLALFVMGSTAKGATSWLSVGGFSFQPVDVMKVVVILMLAKYFSRRHVEINHWKHLLVSALYALIPFLLVLLQPDFGSAVVILGIWFGMALVSGLGRKQLLVLCGVAAVTFAIFWGAIFKPYQKARVLTFLNPASDIQGRGYNVFQSVVAVGSGEVVGKGVGYGTQSRLRFLPEYQTDFIFSAFSEEWGFVGAMLVLVLYGVLIWRILAASLVGATNFEMLYGVGVAIFFLLHIVINVGMNIGVMPVTGIPLPLMSYGGSHLITEMGALGLLMGMRRYARVTHPDGMKNEFLGIA